MSSGSFAVLFPIDAFTAARTLYLGFSCVFGSVRSLSTEWSPAEGLPVPPAGASGAAISS